MLEEICPIVAAKDLVEVIAMMHAQVVFERMNMAGPSEMIIDQEDLTDQHRHLEIFANSMVRMSTDITVEVMIHTMAIANVAVDLAHPVSDRETMKDIGREALVQEHSRQMKMHPFRYPDGRHMTFLTSRSF
jgi:hypothetical protein